MQQIRVAALAGTALVSVLALAGCHTSAHDAASARSRGSGSAAAAPPVAAKRSAQPTASTRHAPLPVTGPCTTAQLSVAASGHRTLDGLDIERFTATDTANLACSVTGTPHLTPYGPLASAPSVSSDIAVSQEDFDGDDEGGSADARIDLQPGQSAVFDVAWYAASPVVCEQGSGFGFSAPDDASWSDMRKVAYRFGSVCDGQFYVSTFRPPTS